MNQQRIDINTELHNGADRLYTAQFLGITVAVGIFMTGVALQFHFGQYLAFLGHGVDTLGRVVSVALVGTLLIRMQLGRWIDHFGCAKAWFVGTLTVAICLSLIQFASSLWSITLLRALWAMGMALAMTTVPVIAARIAPPMRRAESIGTIGVAGFVGMIIGPAMGDWILSAGSPGASAYYVFFTTSAVCSVLACVAMAAVRPALSGPVSTVGPDTRMRLTVRSQLKMVWQHWPGMVLLVATFFNMVFCVQSLYLERLADFAGFRNIKVFFLVYCPTAVVLRLLFRRLPQRIGRRRVIVGGLGLFISGLLCLVGVRTEAQLVLPGLLMGAGHCFVFPSMVDLAAARFPVEHRGTGTALVFTAGDIGTLIGFLALGELIDAFGFDTSLQILAAAGSITCVVFAAASRPAFFSRQAG